MLPYKDERTRAENLQSSKICLALSVKTVYGQPTSYWGSYPAEVKNERKCASTPPYTFTACTDNSTQLTVCYKNVQEGQAKYLPKFQEKVRRNGDTAQ